MQDLPTWGSCEKSFTAPNFDTLPRIEEIFFPWNFWSENIFMLITCVKNFMTKRSRQKNKIPTSPTCVLVRNKLENYFTTSNFDTLPWAENLLFQHEIFGIRSSLY